MDSRGFVGIVIHMMLSLEDNTGKVGELTCLEKLSIWIYEAMDDLKGAPVISSINMWIGNYFDHCLLDA